MRKVKIITDSVSDISLEEAKELDIEVLPLTVIFNEVEYKDSLEIDTKKLFKLMDEHDGFPSTSQVSPKAFKDAMSKYIDEGMDLIVITTSSKLSGTYNSANLMKSQFDDSRIFLIDSLNVTAGEYVLLKEAVRLRDRGFDAISIYNQIEEDKHKVKSCVYLDTLDNLARSGRISKTAGFVGSVLKVKPIIELIDGEIVATSKERGVKKAISHLLNRLETETVKKGSKVCIGSCLESDKISLLEEKCKELGFDYDVLEVGPVTASHIGPYAMGYFLISE